MFNKNNSIMKKFFTLFCAVLMAITVSADLWLEENFNYPDGNLEQEVTQLELRKWIVSRKPADANGKSPQVVNRNLVYPGYPGSGKGKSAVLDAAVGAGSESQRISVYYLDTLGARDTVSMYAAFLFKPLSAQNTSGRDFAIWEGSVGSSMCRGRLILAKSGSKVKFGLSKNNSSSTADWSADVEIGSTNLIVMKYEYNPGGSNDVVKVFINPTLNTAESANICLVSTDTQTDLIVRGFGLRQRGTGAEISGLRIGTSWEDVMGMAADALLLESSDPANNGHVVPETKSLSLVFNKEVTAGSGDITLTEIGGETKKLTPAISGKTVTLPVTLVAEKDYRLSISEGAFVSGTTKNVAIDIDFNTKNPNIYAVEEFHYTAGSELEGQGGWVVSTASADQGGKSPLVADTTLTYADHGVAEGGLSMVLDSVKQEISGDLKRNTLFPFTNDKVSVEEGENVVYTAFMINLSEMNSTSGKDIFAYIKQGAENGANTTMRGRVQVKIVKDKMVFGIRKNSQEITTWSDSVAKVETALLVVKYVNKSTASGNDPDEFFLYVNPDMSKTEAENSALLQTADGNDADGGADLRHICFRQMKLNAIISGIRVAKTWADALNYTKVESSGGGEGGGGEEKQKYTITFVNWDNTKLQEISVEEGTMPKYTGATPVRPEDDDYTYTFTGWNPEIVVASKDATYTAVYEATEKSQGIDTISETSEPQIRKFIKDGQLYILRNGSVYTVSGMKTN